MCRDPLVLRGIPTAALNTTPTRDLGLPIALWLLSSPPDSFVGTGSGRRTQGADTHDFDSARPEKESLVQEGELGEDRR